ncbi:MAG: FlgO family outer membrane protein [Humidesulfovibrio sp.]|nr:FlgO family outer membrane protein [Humidesulfovibrio sp.]
MDTQHRRTIALLALAALASVLLSGCASGPTSYYSGIKRTVVDAKDDVLGTRPTTAEFFTEDATPITDINYDAADTMMGLFSPALNKNSPIYVENFTNRMDMGDTSPFGGLVAEQVAARLAMRNFQITEGRPKKPAAMEQPDPALNLGRKPQTPQEILAVEKAERDMDSPPRPCLLSGTYLIAAKVIYISAKIAALDNGQVMAAHSWTLPVNSNTRAMLPQLRQRGGWTPSVRTTLDASPHRIANPSGQPQNYVGRDLIH